MALLVALALLATLTLAALTAAQTTVLELAMARNDEDAQRALLAAESAVVEAEAWLRANAREPAAMFTASGTGGLFAAPGYGGIPVGRGVSATAGRAAKPVPGVAEPPRYVIEWLGSRNDAGTATNPLPPATVDLYRITARGVGASFATVALQCTYGQTRDGGTGRRLTGRLSWARIDL